MVCCFRMKQGEPECNGHVVYILDQQSRVTMGLTIGCRTDQEALCFVRYLLDDDDNSGQGELWCGNRRIGRITRNVGQGT
jgi:hypothetical protein